MITVTEAAKRLDVSPRRVIALIASGGLAARKSGGIWLVDEDSVDARLRTVSKRGGRPRLGSGRDEVRFMLKNRTHDIAEVVYNREKREFTHVGDVLDLRRAPVGMARGKRALSRFLFNDWWRHRGIPEARDGLSGLLHEAGVEVPEELLERNLGLSLSDQYWVCPEGSGLSWHDVNFFDNGFVRASAAVEGHVPHVFGAAHPDNTSDGNLAKHWEVRGGVRMLRKSGRHLGQEPYNEVVATALHRRLLGPGDYVPYKLDGAGAAATCLCPVFLTSAEEYIPAHYVRRLKEDSPLVDDYHHYVECCRELGVRDVELALAKMIVCDDIIANADRHLRNFGVVRNVETLACRPAPLFDSGDSLWCGVPAERLAEGDFGFMTRPFADTPPRQLLYVEDFSWADERALSGFVDEACDILAGNPALSERLPYIREGLARRVSRMAEIIEWS